MVGMGMQMEGPSTAKKAAAAPKFQELVDAFDKEPIPSSFATPARQAAKKNVVEALRKLPQAASDDEAKKLWQEVQDNMQTISAP